VDGLETESRSAELRLTSQTRVADLHDLRGNE
jgi:hypothetical protein